MKATAIRHWRGLFAAAALVAAGGLSPAPANAAEDAFVCMEESQEKCDRENRNMALFIEGRDAFDRGRESGDLSEARRIAKELIDRQDERHGKALLKFVYVQVSLGVHRNLVEAHRWIQADMAAGETYKRLDLNWVREKLEARMTPEQLAEARRP
ncbi:MAG: hypothetical protein U1F52_17375 [Burkholderiales bacterium]